MKKTERIAALERLIAQYQQSYYNGEAEIADGEFDLLWDELKSLAPDSPVINTIGAGSDGEKPDEGAPLDGFPKAKHLIPMGSQDKAANPEEFLAWARKMGMEAAASAPQAPENGDDETKTMPLTGKKTKLTKPRMLTIENDGLTKIFVVQYKLDGASLELQYEQGRLHKAITRGDGVTGDEITANARRMSGVPEKLDTPFSGGVRGEVVMTREIWRTKYASKANCRNAANGIMRRKDGEGCEDLKLIVYDAAAAGDDGYFQDERHKIEWLAQRGFETAVTKTFTRAGDIIAYRARVAGWRDRLPFDIDGLVVKDSATDMADLRRTRPEKQIAFKFELETAFSILRAVEWSESGATYTPIGIVDPVRLAGTTVQRANLNNPGMIRAMGLKIGSAVSVVKRGEIIPKIEGLAPKGALPPGAQSGAETEIEFPVRCAVCGAELVDGGTRLYCPNPDCPKRLHHRLEKWISVLDIRELGEKLVRQLFEKGRVRQIHELYTLEAAELAEYDRMGELSAAKVVRHIQTKRELSLAAFTAGFDLEGVAETTMEKVAAAGFDTLEKLRAAPVQALAEVYGLGEITAAIIAVGMKETAAEMDAVLASGVISIAVPPPAESLPLKGLSFCFTGELSSMKRGQAEEKIKALGASAKASVVKDLSYLVTNNPESGSSKNKKAHELGAAIIDEAQFLALLAGTEKQLLQNSGGGQGELF
ncbi:MAG: NAD-dependent DNA ligase LigA [Treponema sp.]|jgi:DNA ligase (NAD+)|nr:NAD-dependent DNA ligase LigA [Treponema sp.]